MKIVTLQIKMNVPNNYPLNDSDDIQQLLLDFPNKTVFIDGKVEYNNYDKYYTQEERVISMDMI